MTLSEFILALETLRSEHGDDIEVVHFDDDTEWLIEFNDGCAKVETHDGVKVVVLRDVGYFS